MQALSTQQYDDDVSQSAHQSAPGSHCQTDNSPSTSLEVAGMHAHVAQSSRVAHQPASNDMCDASKLVQPTTASNDGATAAGAQEMRQHANASAHATALEGDCPASDAETDLSVAVRPGTL